MLHRVFYYFFFPFLLVLLALPPKTIADENTDIKITTFHINQESSRHDGVLWSRPRPLDEQIIFLIQANQIRSLEDFSAWLQRNIVYQKDPGGDSWATPQETLQNGFGDCEDFAFLVAEVLRILGYESKVIVLRKNNRAHAACVFQWEGRYCWFDNNELKKTSLHTWDEFAREITLKYNLSSLGEIPRERYPHRTLALSS